MILLIPNEVALSPDGGDLAFDTDFGHFYQPVGFDGDQLLVSTLDLARLKRLSPAMKWVKQNLPAQNRQPR